jgi:hypothetical protein
MKPKDELRSQRPSGLCAGIELEALFREHDDVQMTAAALPILIRTCLKSPDPEVRVSCVEHLYQALSILRNSTPSSRHRVIV